MNTDYEDRLDMIDDNIPTLLCSYHQGESVLYVGAKPNRMDYIPELFDAFYDITVLEVDPKNASELLEMEDAYLIDHVLIGDVREVDMLLPDAKYDVVFTWHVIEHLPGQVVPDVLAKLESITKKYVVIGTPWGYVPQGTVDGNVNERHLSYWEPEDFRRLGYQAVAIGEPDVMGSCILAWKEMG